MDFSFIVEMPTSEPVPCSRPCKYLSMVHGLSAIIFTSGTQGIYINEATIVVPIDVMQASRKQRRNQLHRALASPTVDYAREKVQRLCAASVSGKPVIAKVKCVCVPIEETAGNKQ